MEHRILCVEDEPLVLRALVRTLGLVSWSAIDTATNAREAEELIQRRHYSVIVTDYQMPGPSGIDLAEHVASHHPQILTILVTGHTELRIVMEAINRGHVYAFLAKPWSAESLLSTVRRACERFELSRTLHEKISDLERTNAELTKAYDDLRTTQAQVHRLEKLASTDEKTGARTYRYLAERLEEEVARSRRYELPLGLMLLDLDGFKSVNDRFGHMVGDDVLRGVADVLRDSIREVDLLARFGGDEFAILLPNTNLGGASILGERLRQGVCETALEPVDAGEVTVSMGIAAVPEHSVANGSGLLELADAALYQAKQMGRNRFVVADVA